MDDDDPTNGPMEAEDRWDKLLRNWLLLLGLGILVALAFTVGRGGRGEFSPFTLEFRGRSEYTILILQHQFLGFPQLGGV
jgi:hypothetical protein